MGKKVALVILLTGFLIFHSGCSILFGNVKAQTEKSESYSIADLSRLDSDWVKLDRDKVGSRSSSQSDRDPEESQVSDVVFQSRRTASIISLNSSCNEEDSEVGYDLEGYSRLLLLGVNNVKDQKQESLKLGSADAIQTTLEGEIGSERMKLRAVVLKHRNCVYDMMYVSHPDRFESQVEQFSHFTRSFKPN